MSALDIDDSEFYCCPVCGHEGHADQFGDRCPKCGADLAEFDDETKNIDAEKSDV